MILNSGVTRAEAMAYRDARREAMTGGDWVEIERQLLRAYQLLRSSVGGPRGEMKKAPAEAGAFRTSSSGEISTSRRPGSYRGPS